MGDPSLDVFVALFDDERSADRAERALSDAEAEGRMQLLAAAVIARRPDGRAGWRVRGPEPGLLTARAEAIATMLGVLLPADVVVAGLTASVDDGEAGHAAREGFGEAFAAGVAEAIPPDGALVIAVVDDRWVSEIGRGLRGYHRLAR